MGHIHFEEDGIIVRDIYDFEKRLYYKKYLEIMPDEDFALFPGTHYIKVNGWRVPVHEWLCLRWWKRKIGKLKPVNERTRIRDKKGRYYRLLRLKPKNVLKGERQ